MRISSHEAGHCVVATILGYQAGAMVAPTRSRATCSHIEDTTHKSAIALAGGLGDYFYHQPNGSSEEARRYIADGRGCSMGDWQQVAGQVLAAVRSLLPAVHRLKTTATAGRTRNETKRAFASPFLARTPKVTRARPVIGGIKTRDSACQITAPARQAFTLINMASACRGVTPSQ